MEWPKLLFGHLIFYRLQPLNMCAIEDSPLDEYFPPVDLGESNCNCTSSSPYCLVAMTANTLPMDVVSNASSEEDSPVCSDGETSPLATNEDFDHGEVEYFSESFSVKGSC